MKKVIIYYTDNKLDKNIASYCFKNLVEVSQGIPIVLVSQRKTSFLFRGEIIVEDKSKSRQSMFEQIQVGLQTAKRIYQPDFVFLAEHDVLYPEEYFNFESIDKENYFYSDHTYYMTEDHFVRCGYLNLSTLCCSFNLLLSHVNWRLYRMQHLGMKKGGLTKCEPGASVPSEKYKTLSDPSGSAMLRGEKHPCVDIRHENNLSKVDLSRSKLCMQIPYWEFHQKLKENMKWVTL